MAERTHFDQERQRELSQPSLLFRAILSLTCGSNLGFPDDNHRAFHPGQQVQIDLLSSYWAKGTWGLYTQLSPGLTLFEVYIISLIPGPQEIYILFLFLACFTPSLYQMLLPPPHSH